MPAQVGVYKILEKIGEGGMGDVYRGLDTMLEREVAIKVLRPDLAGRGDIADRFRAEAVTLGRLNHPNIVTVYSCLREGETFYVVLEFVRGETLDAMIRRRGRLPWQEAVGLVIQALRGLEHAHRMHVIHRDLKPANAILTDDGTLKLMDFGIARILNTARMTRVGHLIGTLQYMAPEQVQGTGGDARSDLYSLSVVLYELLAGRVPFEGATDYELIKAQVEASPPPLQAFGVVIPPPLAEVLARALSKSPDRRFQSAGELAHALRAMPDHLEPAVPTAGGRGSSDPVVGRRAIPLRALSARARTWPHAVRSFATANPIVAGASVMVLIGLGLALAPRSGKMIGPPPTPRELTTSTREIASSTAKESRLREPVAATGVSRTFPDRPAPARPEAVTPPRDIEPIWHASVAKAKDYYKAGDYASAAPIFQRAAGEGSPEAMRYLASLYERGRGGLAKDDREAARWYRKGADAGDGLAMAKLGVFYLRGTGGLTKNEAEALRWFRKGVDAGDGRSMADLGFMYESGRGGLAKDEAEAVRWYRKGSEVGDGLAMANLGSMYVQGRGGLAKNEAEALRWYRKGSEVGDGRAMANLGSMYVQGRGGLAKNEAEALRWYRKGSEVGDGFAMANLGFMYVQGAGRAREGRGRGTTVVPQGK